MLKRKAALASGEEAPDEELEVRATRGAGKVKPPDRPLSAAEWGKLKESLGNPHRFDIKMISALFTSRAELAIAKSLLTFVATETGTLSYELLLLYLTLCVRGGHDEEELERFKAFVQRKPAFDVVVDGLNVANTNKDKSQLSATLLAVVSELDRQGLTVLVLGRKHMLYHTRSWDKHSMRLIQQKAHCFFTENISEDDPFLLYATLHSGNHCRFVSRDLMRDHKACLPDGHTRRLFFKWQRGHQLVVDGQVAADRRVRFQSIPSYDTSVQTSGDSWHIPYDNTGDRTTYEVPQQWLCLTQKH
ncbi:hypothetical protein F2P81_003802 [Scophthalmus maximus]|uniref:PRORP domain-containing protein n=1 Tax=Scophthalmus maximus TaxID=52904 RepID=A0A6A4TN19_SCOMX|nr:hypothetical protein F2P81_003802 [Scophthalmus maximus]